MYKIKDLKKYYEQKVSWSEEDQVFIVRFPELPGCSTHGKTREEAAKNAEEALESHLQGIESVEGKLPTPLALAQEKKVPLRLRPDIYKSAEDDADKLGMSFNKYTNESLELIVKSGGLEAIRNRVAGAGKSTKRRA